MAYATITETQGTLETFAQVNAYLPSTPPEGLLLGIRGMSERGLTVVTVWRSREDADRYDTDHLGPAVAQVAGDPTPPPFVSLSIDDVTVWGQGVCSWDEQEVASASKASAEPAD